MSIESAREFLARMRTDRDFAKEIAEAPGPDERTQLAVAAGFEFTGAELKEARESAELSDDELDAVAGGQGPYTVTTDFGDVQNANGSCC